MTKKSFILYKDQYETIKILNKEQKADLLDALFLYVRCEDNIELDTPTHIVFTMIKSQLVRDKEDWDKELEKRKLAGHIGGVASAEKKKLQQNNNLPIQRPSTTINDHQRPSTIVNDRQANQADNVTVNVTVTDTVTVNVTDKEIQRLTQLFYDQIKVNTNPTVWNKKPPVLEKWAEDIDKMHRIDGLDYSLIESLIMFATTDNFWKSNILSGSKLREQSSTLEAHMKRPKNKWERQQPTKNDVEEYLRLTGDKDE